MLGRLECQITLMQLIWGGWPRAQGSVGVAGGGVGEVTSGNMSPMLGEGIGMAYVSPPPTSAESVEVEIRGRWVSARLAKPPFHKSVS